MRLVAYRQYTWWIHGHLGRRIRIAIPSCAVSAIRDVYPEAYPGSYRGVEDGEDSGYPGITIDQQFYRLIMVCSHTAQCHGCIVLADLQFVTFSHIPELCENTDIFHCSIRDMC